MSHKLRSPIKFFGGKSYLAKRIIALMPSHIHYVETHAGGLSVLLAKPFDGVSEVANDINHRLTDFWRVLADPDQFQVFSRTVSAIPFSKIEFNEAKLTRAVNIPSLSPIVRRAVAFFIQARMSHSGRMKDFAAFSRTRTRRGMNEQASAWLSAVEGLEAVHKRLMRVAITYQDAAELISQQDHRTTLFYCDPPYMHESRANSNEYGEFEMTVRDHEKLLIALRSIKGKFLLSGYRSKLYDNYAKRYKWSCVDIKIPNHASGEKSKRIMTECVWMNYRR